MAQVRIKSICFSLVLGWLSGLTALYAQTESGPVRLSSLNSDTTLTRLATWRMTPAHLLPADTLDGAAYGLYQSPPPAMAATAVHWLRLRLHNDLPTTQRRILASPYQNDEVSVYSSLDGGRNWRHQRLGTHASYHTSAYRHSNLLLPLDLQPSQEVLLIIKVQSVYFGAADPTLRLIDEATLKADFWALYAGGFQGYYLSVFVLGAVLAIFLFVGFLYSTTRDRLYLFYGLYLGGVGLYFCAKTDTLFFLGYLFHGFPKMLALLNEPVQMLYTALYIRFSMGLLRMADYDPRLYRFLDVIWKGLILYALGLTVVTGLVWSRSFENTVLAVDRIVLLVFNVLMLARLIQKNRSPLLYYFLAGNVLFFAGVVFSTVASLGHLPTYFYEGLAAISYFQIGVLAEIMCFSFALGYNVRVLERERNANQQAYITQLRLNRDMSETANRQLTEKLEKRTREVMEISDALQFQKEANLRSEFEYQLSEMEMQALRAQMNPHFIFNSLNTIRYFVLNNENDKASDYLGKFARLLRMVLQNSRENTIPLSEELEALRLYLEIESRRFGECFEYQILIDEGLDIDEIIVPPLLLQPFAENAIWHGLLHSERPDKKLVIRILDRPDACLFLIEDNGVGRERAQEMKSRSAHVKKSFGMQITTKRVELFNKNFSSRIEIFIRDLVSPDGQPAGTAVEILYKFNFE